MPDKEYFDWSDAGSLVCKLAPVLYPEFVSTDLRECVAAQVSATVVLKVYNLIGDLPVTAKLIVKLSETVSYEVPLEGAYLHPIENGNAHLCICSVIGQTRAVHLDLAKLQVYGEGKIGIEINSPRFAADKSLPTGWIPLHRAFVLETQSGEFASDADPVTKVDLALAMQSKNAFDNLLVGDTLRMRFSHLPPELLAADLRVGFRLDAGGKNAVAVDNRVRIKSGAWSQPISVGIDGRRLSPDLVGADGRVAPLLVVSKATQAGTTEHITELMAIPACASMEVPKLLEFKLEVVGPLERLASYLAPRGAGLSCPLWKGTVRFGNVHPQSIFLLNLMAIYSPDGCLDKLEVLPFASTDLMGQMPVAVTDPTWAYSIAINGGNCTFFLFAAFHRPAPLAVIDYENPIGLVLCQARPSEIKKSKPTTFSVKPPAAKAVAVEPIPLSFVALPISRFAVGSEVWGRKLVPELRRALPSSVAGGNALGSNLLNMVYGKTGSSAYPSHTLAAARDLQFTSLAGVLATLKADQKDGTEKWTDRGAVLAAMDPSTRWYDERYKYQFMKIGAEFLLPQDKLEAWLGVRKIGAMANPKNSERKWSLDGMAAVFNAAAKEQGINVLYLVGHCLMETGGFLRIKGIYNAFGIGAVDSGAAQGGANYGSKNDWTTPEKAILGGAQFIRNHFTIAGQDTLYKMRWNPAKPASHQYCTSLTWCDGISQIIGQLLEMAAVADHANIVFDLPYYSDQVKPL